MSGDYDVGGAVVIAMALCALSGVLVGAIIVALLWWLL